MKAKKQIRVWEGDITTLAERGRIQVEFSIFIVENWNAVLKISFRFIERVVKVEVFRIGVIGRRVLTLTAGVCFRVAFGVVKVTVTRDHIHIIREAGVIPEAEVVA